jgi:hypothetical protein
VQQLVAIGQPRQIVDAWQSTIAGVGSGLRNARPLLPISAPLENALGAGCVPNEIPCRVPIVSSQILGRVSLLHCIWRRSSLIYAGSLRNDLER